MSHFGERFKTPIEFGHCWTSDDEFLGVTGTPVLILYRPNDCSEAESAERHRVAIS